MKVIIAPDKFKGSLSALQVCKAIERGIRQILPQIEIISHPLGDGGEGSLDILADHLSLIKKKLTVCDPLSRPIETYYYHDKNSAYIEMAAQSGLMLLKKEEQNVMKTTTLGTGEVIADAIKAGCTNIYLMIGGSATNDGGTGILQALGYEFKDEKGAKLIPIGENLSKIRSVEYPGRIDMINEITFNIICDVKNPFYGPYGAAKVYGKQKGIISEEDIDLLDCGLENFAKLIQRETGIDLNKVECSGAAGGVGGGLFALLNSKILPGTQTIMQLTGFAEKSRGADLVITGEGKVDSQTLSGKVVYGVTEYCTDQRLAVGILCGISETDHFEQYATVYGPYPIKKAAISTDKAISEAAQLLTERTAELLSDFISDQKGR
ncbi:MAG: glycerate kinase [Cyclobacteriaceae bacterium]